MDYTGCLEVLLLEMLECNSNDSLPGWGWLLCKTMITHRETDHLPAFISSAHSKGTWQLISQ